MIDAIEGAISNWIARTHECTAESLVKYINSKWDEPMSWPEKP